MEKLSKMMMLFAGAPPLYASEFAAGTNTMPTPKSMVNMEPHRRGNRDNGRLAVAIQHTAHMKQSQKNGVLDTHKTRPGIYQKCVCVDKRICLRGAAWPKQRSLSGARSEGLSDSGHEEPCGNGRRRQRKRQLQKKRHLFVHGISAVLLGAGEWRITFPKNLL